MNDFSLSDDFFTYSESAQSFFLSSDIYKNAKIVCAFSSMNDEIQTKRILERTIADKKKLALPCVAPRVQLGAGEQSGASVQHGVREQCDVSEQRVASEQRSASAQSVASECRYASEQRVESERRDVSDVMHFYFVSSLDSLQKNRWGICEPVPDKKNIVQSFEGAVFLVPGRAFTLNGERLGRGKGFYDSFLSDVKKNYEGIVAAGFCFDWQVFPSLPCDTYDQKMTYIVTERGVVKCE
ncbi:MAG: hypothetical protein IKI31_04235 [Treponema sp.]|nr:hypothetical protein [Treponema sp.]